MTVSQQEPPDGFNFFAGIDAYKAAREAAERLRDYASGAQYHADALKAIQSTAERTQEYTSSAQFQIDAMEAARSAIDRMRQQSGALDSFNRPNAKLAVRANEDWLEVERKKAENSKAKPDAADQQQDADQDDGDNAAVQPHDTQINAEQERIVEMLASLQGIHTQSAASAQSLKEIRAAHVLAERRQSLADKRQTLADNRQKSQDKFNSRITVFGLVVAGASLIASVVMPTIENFLWKADESKAAQTTASAAPQAPEPISVVDSPQTAKPGPGEDCPTDVPPPQFLSCHFPTSR